MKPLLVYDCEIVKGIPSNKEPAVPGIEYCAGWRDFANMGISVIGAYDYDTDRYRVFLEDGFQEFAELVQQRTAVAFNGRAFDDRLIAAHGMPPGDTYDLLVEIWAGAGLGPEFRFQTHAGYGLDAVCERNFGLRKTGNGALAPVLWQQGKRGQVIDYCLQDVKMEKTLMDAIVAKGWILSPVNDQVLHVRTPKQIEADFHEWSRQLEAAAKDKPKWTMADFPRLGPKDDGEGVS